MKKVKDFIDCISRSTSLQDVAFRTKTLKLHSGEFIPIPGLVRTMTGAKIVYLCQEECKRENKDPLKERTCFRIIEVRSASQQSLQGHDNTSTPAAKAFETLQTLVDNIARKGAGVTWSREIGRALTADKQYLKGEYKSHLGPDECCADHCTVYALSDPERVRAREEFAFVCDHSHDLTCSNWQSIRNALQTIEEQIEKEKLELTARKGIVGV